jgi:hypothetical protein
MRQATAAEPIVDLAFSADGRRIVTGGDQKVSVWDRATLTPVLTATVPGGGISRVALAPDVIAITLHDVRSHRFDRTAWIERACAIVGRGMTNEEWARLALGRPRFAICP